MGQLNQARQNYSLQCVACCACLALLLLACTLDVRRSNTSAGMAPIITRVDSQADDACAYGSLPGTWVSSAPLGSRWQSQDAQCTLTNRLARLNATREALSILLLSDSVDYLTLGGVCSHLGGTKRMLKAVEHDSVVNATTPRKRHHADLAYGLHVCDLGPSVPLKIGAAYFPGVSPSGPYHLGLQHNFSKRFEDVSGLWRQYARQPPQAVSVSSAMWDMARLYLHAPQTFERGELDVEFLQEWSRNFTAVVAHARSVWPQARSWLTHTTMPPKHNASTGATQYTFLGRRYYYEQLNAALAAAASALGLQLVDTAAVARRFADGQKHLADANHPTTELALECFNLMLNVIG